MNVGVTFVNGKIVPTGSYSASMYQKQVDKAETTKMDTGAAGKKTVNDAKINTTEFTYTTTEGAAITQQVPAGGTQSQSMSSAEAYAQALSDPQVGARVREGFETYTQEQLVRMERQERINETKQNLTQLRNELNITNEQLNNGGNLSVEEVKSIVIRQQELKRAVLNAEVRLGTLYREQLMDYRIEGNYYVSNVDGVEVRMSRDNFSPPATSVGTGNTPINFAISRIDPRALVVLVENSQTLNLDSVEVSSLWREHPNSPVHTPIPSRGIDIVAATRGDVTVRFNNTSDYASQYTANSGFIQEVHNAFQNDPRVSQVLDPYWMYSGIPNNTIDYANVWNQPKPPDVSSGWYGQMGAHNNHLHITIWSR